MEMMSENRKHNRECKQAPSFYPWSTNDDRLLLQGQVLLKLRLYKKIKSDRVEDMT